jgi:acetylornithine/succinyldiaminopimelate/putrescine aminotransferase
MFAKVERSLKDLLGYAYVQSLKECNVRLFGAKPQEMDGLLFEKVDFFPAEFEKNLDRELDAVGKQVVQPFSNGIKGAASDSFTEATNAAMSPLGGKGFFRVGEDGKLYLAAKSEHYHVSLGHHFPGFKLVDNAKKAGVVNATHNNTRGYITRVLEDELIRVANGIKRGDHKSLEAVLQSEEAHVLNRVINLETGSLGVEAGLKMMLARFFKQGKSFGPPKYEGKTPVFFVMGDHAGGGSANYHGTTVIMQTMRGLWSGFYEKEKKAGAYEVVPLRINDIRDLKSKMEFYNRGDKKVAGFFHEIILMSYGAITLDRDYLQEAYFVCHANDVPVLADEIQSCLWYKELYLYRDYGLNPDFVVVGKGFSGGEYPASKILLTKEMDNLNQFGALVTNGQEELASLSYLVAMEFALENADKTQKIGKYYRSRADELAAAFPDVIGKIEGIGHLLAIHFKDAKDAARFAKILNDACIDVSEGVQSAFLPAVLTKLPLAVTMKAVDFITDKMRSVLMEL